MAATREDKDDFTKRFTEVYGTTDHPLYEGMISDLESGKRLKSSIMTDLAEAAKYRAQTSKEDDSKLYIASL